jgi:O-antigen biosynthesis protein
MNQLPSTTQSLQSVRKARELFKNGMYTEAAYEAETALRLTAPGDRPEALLKSIIEISKKKESESLPISDFYQSSSPALPAIDKEKAALFDTLALLTAGTSIIIPVFNSHAETAKCLESVYLNTSPHIRVIVIDDFSDDRETIEVLSQARSAFNFHVYRNSTNLGFAGSVNLGIKLAESEDVVILNSDTIVSPGWMTGLKLRAYSAKENGTVTAVSNSAGPFSLKSNLCDGIVEIKDVVRIQRLLNNPCSPFLKQNAICLPTGHGFCMYIKRSMLEATGELDQQAFPHGYGEENDLCLRASMQGFTHRLDTQTFVYHKNAASFGERKKSLVSQGRKIIDTRYPYYKKQITSCFEGEEFKQAIRSAESRLSQQTTATVHQPPVPFLFLASTKTGGTPQTNLDLMKELKTFFNIQPYCFYCREDKIEISTIGGNGEEVFGAPIHLSEKVVLPSHNSAEYIRVFAYILDLLRIRLVHIRHLGWHSSLVSRICRSAGIPCIFSLHDFYTICPNVKLIDVDKNYCKGVCSHGNEDCKVELWTSYPGRLRGEGVIEWRSTMNEVLLHCDSLITTSASTRALIENIYPTASSSRPFYIIEHGRERNKTESKSTDAGNTTLPIKVLVPGNITEAKGGLIIKQLVNDPEIDFVDFHVLGKVQRSLALHPAPNLVLHGEYRREDFNDRVTHIKPDVGLVFSIWPETYCHTLSELWMAGIPVIGSDLGAVGERLRLHRFGWAVPADYQSLKQHLRALANDLYQILAIRDSLAEENTRPFSSHVRSAHSMAIDYVNVYRRLLSDIGSTDSYSMQA